MWSLNKFKEFFVRFRGGNSFVIAVFGFLITWFTLKYLSVINDPDNGTLNLIFSIEASLATSWLLDLNLKQDDNVQDKLRTILEEEQEIQEHFHS